MVPHRNVWKQTRNVHGKTSAATNTITHKCTLLTVARILLLGITVGILFQWMFIHDFLFEHDNHHAQHHMNYLYGPASLFLPCSTTLSSSRIATIPDSICRDEFRRVTTDLTSIQVPTGLSVDDFERSVAHVGNRYRLAQFANRLIESSSFSLTRNDTASSAIGRPLAVLVCGGSISLGHGVTPVTSRYSDQLEVWLNTAYPITNRNDTTIIKHQVYNRGAHGADVRL
jgi:hypothetical protein